MKVAIVHYWIVNSRGGEAVLEELCKLFPTADIFTHVVDRKSLSQCLKKHKITTTFISKLPFSRRFYKIYLPLMPVALEALDLQKYDLIVSSESGPAKGVIPSPSAKHLCYVHSPMRYIWDQSYFYTKDYGFLKKAFFLFFSHHLRIWDSESSNRVDAFIANSTHVANRVEKYYRRSARVIHPPVDVSRFKITPREKVGAYYLWVGELVSYKRPDIAIEAFGLSGKPLVVIGGGEEEVSLRRNSGNNIEFLGRVPQSTLVDYISRCRALIFPGEEDFGIVPVEALASGRPVIGFARGGILDIVQHGVNGVLYDDPSVEGLNSAVDYFEKNFESNLDPEELVRSTDKFTADTFRKSISNSIKDLNVVPLNRNENSGSVMDQSMLDKVESSSTVCEPT